MGSEYSQTLINKGVLQFRHVFKSRRLNQKIQYIADVLYFFIVSALQRDLRVGAVLREQNALPYKTWKNVEFVGKARR